MCFVFSMVTRLKLFFFCLLHGENVFRPLCGMKIENVFRLFCGVKAESVNFFF
jgi:hypothetical protein